jgi:hypothetical protein
MSLSHPSLAELSGASAGACVLALLTAEPTVLFGLPHQRSADELNIAAICFMAVMKDGEFCIKLQRRSPSERTDMAADTGTRRSRSTGQRP